MKGEVITKGKTHSLVLGPYHLMMPDELLQTLGQSEVLGSFMGIGFY